MNQPLSDSPATSWATRSPAQRAIHARLLQVMPALAVRLRPDATLTECGSDSLDLVELLCIADTDYGVRLSIDEVGQLNTVGDLILLIDTRATKRPSLSPS